jgi:hypothetical protein
MNRLWKGAILLGFLLLYLQPVLAQQKPNILVIWGDDVGYWNISAYNHGMMGYHTPNSPWRNCFFLSAETDI